MAVQQLSLDDIRCIAVDFGGTLAGRGQRPSGELVERVMRSDLGLDVRPGFAQAFESARSKAAERDRPVAAQTNLDVLIAAAAAEAGLVIPRDLSDVVDRVFTELPDAEVGTDSTEALRSLHRMGLTLVLASDTLRTEASRRRTLERAGILRRFRGLVLSSVLGVRKPHPRFYARVIEVAGCRASEILFVGDTVAKDVVGPVACGMHAVLVAGPGRAREGIPPGTRILRTFPEVVGLCSRA